MNVARKTAAVTGAGSGINLAFAALLLENHCNVLIADLALRPEAEALVTKYDGSAGAAKAYFCRTDVTEWRDLDCIFDTAVKEFGGLDIVCPGAGVYEPPWSNFWHPPGSSVSKDVAKESRYKLVDINITHPIRLTQLAITHFLIQKRPGCIIHISSVAGQVPFFPTPVYVASKHAISGFVRSLHRLEFPPASTGLPKIRVVAVAPGKILTPLWTDHPDKMKFVSEETGWVTAEDVAVTMLDLVQKEEHIGGTILEVGATVRKVNTLNDPGPAAGSNDVKSSKEVEDDMWAALVEQFKGAS